MIYATETADIRPLQKDEYSILCTADSATENLVFLTFCHTDRPRNPEIYGSIIQITFNSHDIAEPIRNNALPLFTQPYRITPPSDSARFCLYLCRKAASDNPADSYHTQMLHSLLNALLSELTQIHSVVSRAGEFGEKRALITNAISYIETHYSEKLSIEKLAKIAYMSKSYFSHSFKEIVGETPVEYINRLRISAAVKLVGMDNFSTHELAEKLVFSSNSYFCYTFKKFTGMSPRQFGKFSDSTLSLSPEQKNFGIII